MDEATARLRKQAFTLDGEALSDLLIAALSRGVELGAAAAGDDPPSREELGRQTCEQVRLLVDLALVSGKIEA